MVSQVLGYVGRIDILVNSQGVAHLEPSVNFDEEAWQRVIDVNLKSVFLCCKHVGREMVAQGKGRSSMSRRSVLFRAGRRSCLCTE